tara:strand:+ start:151 stop:408 length:258 start_codon:yes stop_codon:yes gene_type:complete
MNKAKLVELADEVLTDIDVGMKSVQRNYLEKKLLDAMTQRFLHARYRLNYSTTNDKEWAKKYEKEYQSVKPILDDSIDKLLGETK